MKKLFLSTLIVFILCGLGFSQDKVINEQDVPKVVFDAYKLKYSNAVTKKWTEGDDNYEVLFDLKGTELEASFSFEGKWLETLKELEKKNIPEVVLKGFKKSKFGKWKIIQSSTAETPEYKLLYFIEVKKRVRKIYRSHELYFTPEGELIKTE